MKTEDVKLVAYAAALAGAVVLSIVDYRKVTRKEKATRAKIESETKDQISAIGRAEAIVIDRIKRGEYAGKGWPAVMNDMKFETIIARIQED